MIENKALVKQKADKDNTIVILNKNDFISRLNQILDYISKFKRLHIQEGKALKVHFQVWDNFWQLKALWKLWKILFISPQKIFLFSRYLKFLSWLFGHVAKLLDKKDKVNFKFYDVTAWLINNCNTHIAQYLER